MHQAHYLAAWQRRARRLRIEPHAVVHKLLDTQPLGQRPCQKQSRVADEPLLIEANRDLIQCSGALDYVRVIVHHSGDLLTGPRLPHTTAEKPCSGGHLNPTAGRNRAHYAVDPGFGSGLGSWSWASAAARGPRAGGRPAYSWPIRNSGRTRRLGNGGGAVVAGALQPSTPLPQFPATQKQNAYAVRSPADETPQLPRALLEAPDILPAVTAVRSRSVVYPDALHRHA